MVEFVHVSVNPHFIVNGFIQSGIIAALNGVYGSDECDALSMESFETESEMLTDECRCQLIVTE